MKNLALSLKRLACCMSPESIPEPADRVASPSSALRRPASQSSARSQSPNETVPAHIQDANPTATSFTESPTMDDANEGVPARSSSNTPSTSTSSPPRPEPENSPKQTTDTVLCALERLPVELQTRILCESSLDSLPALLRSSPRFYYVYSQNRLPILRTVLIYALDGFFLDAYAACMSDRYFDDAARPSTWEQVRDEYDENPDTVPSTLAIDGISLAVTQKMAHFHLRVVEPLTERYCRWALGAISSSPQLAPLTKTEKSHIQRAMYRLQVICHSRIGESQLMLSVLDSFGPWATEQILCVHKFAKERMMSAFIECELELNEEENPSHSQSPLFGWKEGLLLYHSEYLNDGTLYDVLSQGLPVLIKTFQAEGPEALCDVIQKNVNSNGGSTSNWDWIDESVGDYQQFERRWYSVHDELQDKQRDMLFEQDDLLSPPLAWVTFWNGRYSNQFGGCIPDALHRWGYVMWDAKRLKESGAMEYIELEWQSEYGIRGSPEDDDPRDYYIAAYQEQRANDY